MKKSIILVVVALVMIPWALVAEEAGLEVRIERREAFDVLGFQIEGTMEPGPIMDTWMKYMEAKPSMKGLVGGSDYGVTYYGPNHDGESMEGVCYLVGGEAKEVSELSEELVLHRVPSALYAVFSHKGPVDTINESYQYIFGQWFRETGRTPLMQDVFEEYGMDFIPDGKESITYIWVPILDEQTGE